MGSLLLYMGVYASAWLQTACDPWQMHERITVGLLEGFYIYIFLFFFASNCGS